MTWNPLKKQSVIQKPASAHPCLTAAEDRELEITVQRIIHVENTIRQMVKEIKKYLSSIQNVDYADQHLTENLSLCTLVHINDEFRRIVEDYHSVTTQIGKTVQETVELCNKTFIDPLKKILKEFVYIRDALNKREELVNIWKTAYANYKKYQEKKDKTASHHVKLEKERKAEEQVSKDLKIYHARLLAELPMFLEKRLEYLKPSVQALIAIQLDYYGNSTKMFTQLMPVTGLDSPRSSMISEEEYNETINSEFNKIKNLTIVRK